MLKKKKISEITSDWSACLSQTAHPLTDWHRSLATPRPSWEMNLRRPLVKEPASERAGGSHERLSWEWFIDHCFNSARHICMGSTEHIFAWDWGYAAPVWPTPSGYICKIRVDFQNKVCWRTLLTLWQMTAFGMLSTLWDDCSSVRFRHKNSGNIFILQHDITHEVSGERQVWYGENASVKRRDDIRSVYTGICKRIQIQILPRLTERCLLFPQPVLG